MTDRLEDESVWAAHLYAEAGPRAESKETIEVRLNSRLVKERFAIGFSWIISTWCHQVNLTFKRAEYESLVSIGHEPFEKFHPASNTKMHHGSVVRHWTLVSVL